MWSHNQDARGKHKDKSSNPERKKVEVGIESGVFKSSLELNKRSHKVTLWWRVLWLSAFSDSGSGFKDKRGEPNKVLRSIKNLLIFKSQWKYLVSYKWKTGKDRDPIVLSFSARKSIWWLRLLRSNLRVAVTDDTRCNPIKLPASWPTSLSLHSVMHSHCANTCKDKNSQLLS